MIQRNNKHKRQLLTCGGAGGHLQHLYDNQELTFAELKSIINDASDAKLEKVTEKVDGQNLFITWNVSQGSLRAARNKGDLKKGGMDADALSQKFEGRGSVYDAFTQGFRTVRDAIESLSHNEQEEIFGLDGNIWFSIEIVYSKNSNVISYDKNNIVFHEAGQIMNSDGTEASGDVKEKFKSLMKHIERMQKAVTDKSWAVNGPAFIALKKMDGIHANTAINKIDHAIASVGVSNSDSIGDYMRKYFEDHVITKFEIPKHITSDVIDRMLGTEGAPTITQITKGLDKDVKQEITNAIKAAPQHLKVAIRPIEMAIHDFAVEVLRGLKSFFVTDSDVEVKRLRAETQSAIDAIKSSGDEKAMSVLAAQLPKMKRLEDIATSMEGITFQAKGQLWKMTGNFAVANQLIGLFKYGRVGSAATETKTEAILKRYIRSILV